MLGPGEREPLPFSVNKAGRCFGLERREGRGQKGAVEAIVRGAGRTVPTPIHDLMRRVDLRAANRKALESLAHAGAFDGLGTLRAHFFH